MEKGLPHYSLLAMQEAIAQVGIEAFTQTAMRGGSAMGLTQAQMLDVIANLTYQDFYKSMTTHNDHRIWQNVYHGRCPNGMTAYIKLTLVNERIVIQFKEK